MCHKVDVRKTDKTGKLNKSADKHSKIQEVIRITGSYRQKQKDQKKKRDGKARGGWERAVKQTTVKEELSS